VSNNPAKDQLAFVGIGRAGYHRDNNSTDSLAALTLRACQNAILDAGLKPEDIDGVCGSQVNSQYVELGLGLSHVTWFSNPEILIGNQIVAARNAIWSGAASTVLIYHSVFRLPFQSKSIAADPFRIRASKLEERNDYRGFFGVGHVEPEPYGIFGSTPYASWAIRYLHESGGSREDLALVAMNAHTNALDNPDAIHRFPLSVDDYMNARMVREPFCVYDMDVVVDGADAFVLTTAERAADLAHKPVLLHSATLGRGALSNDTASIDLRHTSQRVAADQARNSSDVWTDDFDVLAIYDGFSIIPILWLENLGFCPPGEGLRWLADCWDTQSQRLSLKGRTLNPHGGSLTEGATQGSGHVREAIVQLRGTAGARQVPDASSALVATGGIFYNSQVSILRTN